MPKANNRSRLKLLFGLAVASALVAGAFLVYKDEPAGLDPAGRSAKNTNPGPSVPPFNKNLYSTDDPASLWAVVNKGRQLSSTYVPSNLTTPNLPLRFGSGSSEMKLRGDAAAALERLAGAAKKDGLNLLLVSGYRSFGSQAAIYNRNLKADGQAVTDATSARPGHSEHQTGLAVDIGSTSRRCELEKCFADTAEGKWLFDHAQQFGFIIRYEKNKQSKTGYDYEPWHLRYVGVELAAELKKTNQTLEEFFGLGLYPDYLSQPKKLVSSN